MKVDLKVDGLDDLDRLLGELPEATARNTLRRAGVKAAEPMVERMKTLAPVRIGRLKAGIAATAVSGGNAAGKAAYAGAMNSGGSKGEAVAAMRTAQREAGGQPLSIVVSVGPTGKWGKRIAHLVEFGTTHSKPEPFIRPAFDATKDEVIAGVKRELGAEIDKATARLAKKRAKAAGG